VTTANAVPTGIQFPVRSVGRWNDASRAVGSAYAVLLLTSVHHVYGAVIYDTAQVQKRRMLRASVRVAASRSALETYSSGACARRTSPGP
jgi:hypothetical protein